MSRMMSQPFGEAFEMAELLADPDWAVETESYGKVTAWLRSVPEREATPFPVSPKVMRNTLRHWHAMQAGPRSR